MNEMKELVAKLNNWCYEYYELSNPTASDKEFDEEYDKLVQLEKQTGIILSNSPTQNVGYKTLDKLNKVIHKYPMLSLDKCHTEDEILRFAKNNDVVALLKLDGLTTDIVYENSKLIRGETRGDGIEGRDISHNVITYTNIPLTINKNTEIHIIGESVIDYKTFNDINSQIEKEEDKFKNPRNLCSGTVSQLDSSKCAKRNVKFYGYIVEGMDFSTKVEQLECIKSLGFEQCEYTLIPKNKLTKENIECVISELKDYAKENNIPIDGIVFQYNDIKYGKSLGNTIKFPRHSIAYKFYDDVQETKVTNIDFQVGRTGVLTPVVNFEPVEIDGTDVTKASVHNLTILKELNLNIGSKITVKKANMIIPQVVKNLTKETDSLVEIPTICPVCGEPLTIKNDTDSEFLYCSNPNCKAKLIQSISHYCSRNAMNIEGLSEKTIEKFIEKGFIKSIIDIYYLENYKSEIIHMDGFGLKSYNKLIASIDKSRECNLENFIYALGIPNVGKSTAKNIIEYCTEDNEVKHTIDNINLYNRIKWLGMKDCGEVLAKSLVEYFINPNNESNYYNLIDELIFKKKEVAAQKEGVLANKVLYLTGTFAYGKKKELKELVENNGGTFSEKFNKSCDYLVIGSLKGSSKGDKAIKMGIEVLTEEQFLNMLGVD